MRYVYADQLEQGRAAEASLRAWFVERGRRVRPATRGEQYRGIDMWVTGEDGAWHSVELKADAKSLTTGNAFLEVVSSVEKGSDGWALTCSAEWLVIAAGPTLYWLRPGKVRAALDGWDSAYGRRLVKNDSGDTMGVCVPLPLVGGLAECVGTCPPLTPRDEPR